MEILSTSHYRKYLNNFLSRLDHWASQLHGANETGYVWNGIRVDTDTCDTEYESIRIRVIRNTNGTDTCDTECERNGMRVDT